MDQNTAKNRSSEPPRRVPLKGWLGALAAVFLLNVLFYLPFVLTASAPATAALPYSTFLDQVDQGTVRDVTIVGTTLTGNFNRPISLALDGQPARPYARFVTQVPAVGDRLLAQLEAKHVTIDVRHPEPPIALQVLGMLLNALPLLLLLGLFAMSAQAMRQTPGGVGGIFGFGKSRARLYTEERPQVTFADVAGCAEAKAELREVVDFLRDPARYHGVGARIPRGILLVGPPGTGKTLLARAVAGQSGVPFFSISATEFVEMFVGVGAARVRDLFAQAKAKAPCIVFLDEIDAIGRARGQGFALTNDEREQTLNQLLVELDGFEPHQDVVVLAATNRADILDPALLRPGRFDRRVVVDRPDRRGREEILRLHARGKPVDPAVDFERIARATTGLAGADLANLVNEAALAAARRGGAVIGMADFAEATDKIILGIKRGALVDPEERRAVAYHEAGHALVAANTPGADPIQKVTIVPRGQTLGVTQTLPTDDKHNYTRSYLLGRLAIMLGGRVAEEFATGEVTTGAENDLKEVHRLARKMVTVWAMAPGLAPTAYSDDEEDRRLPWDAEPAYSEETARSVDRAIDGLVRDAYERAQTILTAHRAALDRLVVRLLQEETVDGDDVRRLLADYPSTDRTEPELTVQTEPKRLTEVS